MNLVKTSILSFIATFVRVIAGLVINKAISIFIGPSGLAVIGQFQNFQAIIRNFAQGGINSGVVKYSSEYIDNEIELSNYWSTSAIITLACSLVTGLVLFLFSDYFTEAIFSSNEFSYVFKMFSITLVLFSLNQLCLSILNGIKKIKLFISINIYQSIISLFITSLLIYYLKLEGALIALVVNQSIVFFYLLYQVRKSNVLYFKMFTNGFDRYKGFELFNYSLMTIVAAVAAPVSMMIIRDDIGETLSWDYAGYWQAMIYISSTYLMVVTTALSTYYLPKLSGIKETKELRSELAYGYKIILPVVICMSLFVYLLKDFIVWVLFTPDFKEMTKLFKWQLIGDVIKISAWLLSYLMLAKAMTKTFIITEISFSFVYIILCDYFLEKFGFIGLSYAFALNNAIYLVVMMVLMNCYLMGRKR